MSALDDIRAAIKAIPPAEPGFERALMLGWSARRSVDAACAFEGNLKPDYDEVFGIVVRTDVHEFDGWEIREIGEDGVWRDVQPQGELL